MKVGDSVTALSNFQISPELTIPKGTRGKVTATHGHAVLVDWGMPEIGLRWCSIFGVQGHHQADAPRGLRRAASPR